MGIFYSSQTIITEPVPAKVTSPEHSITMQDFGSPLPGAEGDEWEEFNEFLGSIQDSTDQEQE